MKSKYVIECRYPDGKLDLNGRPPFSWRVPKVVRIEITVKVVP